MRELQEPYTLRIADSTRSSKGSVAVSISPWRFCPWGCMEVFPYQSCVTVANLNWRFLLLLYSDTLYLLYLFLLLYFYCYNCYNCYKGVEYLNPLYITYIYVVTVDVTVGLKNPMLELLQRNYIQKWIKNLYENDQKWPKNV